MQTTPKKRSTILVAVGAGVFVLSSGVAVLATRDTGSSKHPARSDTPVAAASASGAGAAATNAAGLVIPADHQAMAVSVPFVQGLAGYAKAGDFVNVYATVEKGQTDPNTAPPAAKLALAGVEVLAVTGPVPGSGAGNTTYLLALDASQAEQAIFFSRFESLWLTLVPKGQPAATTPGRTYQNAF